VFHGSIHDLTMVNADAAAMVNGTGTICATAHRFTCNRICIWLLQGWL